MVKPIASWRASMLIGSRPRGELMAWFIGSATPQNISIDPVPPAKSMANHSVRLYSGCSSSSPRTRLP